MKTVKLVSVVLIILVTTTAFGQKSEKHFGFELSSGVSQAMNKIDGSTVNTGFGFEGIFHYRFLSHTGAYVGWGWNNFGVDDSFAGLDANFEETGYVFGLQYKRPIGNSKINYYLRAGGLYNHIEVENSSGNIIEDTGHGLGFQLAGGIDIPLGNNWRLTPGLKFNSLKRDAQFEGSNINLKYNYASLRIGILKRF